MLKPHPAIEVRFHPQGLPWAGHDGPMAPPLSETPFQIDFHSVTETASDLAHVTQRSVVHTGHQQTMDAFSAPRVTDDHARQHFRRLDLLPGGGTPAWQVPAGLKLGHDAFMPIGHHPLEEAPPQFSRSLEKHQCGCIDLGQQLSKNTTALRKRFLQERPAVMVENVEEHKANRLLTAGVTYPARMRHLMTPQDGVQIRAIPSKHHEFAVHDGAGRETAEYLQLR